VIDLTRYEESGEMDVLREGALTADEVRAQL
jgi:hypothetical protein